MKGPPLENWLWLETWFEILRWFAKVTFFQVNIFHWKCIYPKTESEWFSKTWILILHCTCTLWNSHYILIHVYTGDSEFLSLSKGEFNSILRKDYEDSWNKRLDFFQKSVYFEKMSEDQKRQMADMSEIREYSNNRVGAMTCIPISF